MFLGLLLALDIKFNSLPTLKTNRYVAPSSECKSIYLLLQHSTEKFAPCLIELVCYVISEDNREN